MHEKLRHTYVWRLEAYLLEAGKSVNTSEIVLEYQLKYYLLLGTIAKLITFNCKNKS